MKMLAGWRAHMGWLLVAAIASGGLLVVWRLAVVDAPPSGALFMSGAGDAGQAGDEVVGGVGGKGDGLSATITPFGGVANRGAPTAIGVRAGALPGIADMPLSSPTGTLPVPLPTAPSPTQATISVYVSGAVAKPGVYTLPEGARIEGLMEAAGGAQEGADLDSINLAQRLFDEDHIIVIKKGEATPAAQGTNGASTRSEATPPPGSPPKATPQAARPAAQPTRQPTRQPTATAALTPTRKINLNRATAEELQLIPGIGPATAWRIVADRQQNGPYQALHDLTRISGIKEGIIARIQPYVTVEP